MAQEMIHNTAIISENVRLGKDVEIGPWCIIEEEVVIGDGTKLWQNVYVGSGTYIGKDNIIHMGVILGHQPQHRGFKGERGYLKIGDGNIVREYVTIHRAFEKDKSTVVGSRNYFMAFSHIGHDCKVGNEVVLCNGVLLGGYVTVEDNVFIGGNAAVHQFVRVGRLAMIGGLTRVNQDVVPYTLVECDAEVRGLNIVGMRRAGVSQETRQQIKKAYKLLYTSGLNISNAIDEIQNIPNLSKEVVCIIDFIKSSRRGICTVKRKG